MNERLKRLLDQLEEEIYAIRAAEMMTEARLPSNEAYLAAFQVMLELRACDGVVPAADDRPQWLIEVMQLDLVGLTQTRDIDFKRTACFSPCFATEKQAEAAIESVGGKRILLAMEALAWAES